MQKTATSTGTTRYILHGKSIVHLTNGNDELHFFYDAQGRVAVVDYNGTAYRYVHNLQGMWLHSLTETSIRLLSTGKGRRWIMTASEKKKLLCNRILQRLNKKDYILYQDNIWRVNSQGQYAIRIHAELMGCGKLNELCLTYASFYKPIQFTKGRKKELLTGHLFWLNLFVKSTGVVSPLWPLWKTYEQQCDDILPYFDMILLPILNKLENSLSSYLEFAEKIQDLQQRIFADSRMTDIYEMLLGYLTIGEKEKAKQAILNYACSCRKTIEHIKKGDEPDKQNLDHWQERMDYSNQLLKELDLGETTCLLRDIKERMLLSDAECGEMISRLYN